MKSLLLAAAAAGAVTFAAGQAQAASAVALVGENSLVPIDLDSGKVLKTATVRGAGRLLGIDVRPSNKMLYGV
ncbi:hypothetical protein ABTL82_19385, partial [Acinetobacter baumannii]